MNCAIYAILTHLFENVYSYLYKIYAILFHMYDVKKHATLQFGGSKNVIML